MADQPTNSSLPWLITGLVVGLLLGWSLARATAPEPSTVAAATPAADTDVIEAEDLGGSFEITRVPIAEGARTAAPAETPVAESGPEPTVIDMREPEAEPIPDAETLPAAKVDLRLLGTMMGDGEDRIALIENVKRSKQGVYVEGATLLPGVTLEKVENERVVIDRKGKLEVLRLSRAKRSDE